MDKQVACWENYIQVHISEKRTYSEYEPTYQQWNDNPIITGANYWMATTWKKISSDY